MSTRKTYTPAQMRELAAGRGSQFLMDDMRGALLYAADLIDAADKVIEENRRAIKQPPLMDPQAARDRARIESMAREIYDSWRHHLTGWVPWVEGGNSLQQDEARAKARKELRPHQ